MEYIIYENVWYEGYKNFELPDGKCWISLSGDHYESGSLFDEKPMGFSWADCQGECWTVEKLRVWYEVKSLKGLV